jgi:iron complex transport system substrate-binding protein
VAGKARHKKTTDLFIDHQKRNSSTMKNVSKLFAVLLALMLLLAACAPASAPAAVSTTAAATAAAPTLTETPTTAVAPATGAMTLTDGAGRQVKLNGPAKKIISLAPSNTEILYAVGAGSQVIGRDDFSDYPAEAKALPAVGGNMGKYSLEQIAALQPDLVLAASLNTPEQIKSLEDLKINVFVIANPTTFDGLFANLETVGSLTGQSAKAASLVASLKQRVQTVTDEALKAGGTPKVFYELDATDPSKPWTAGPGSFITALIQTAGGSNIGSTLSTDYAQISQEALISINPEVILLGDAAYNVTPDQVAKRPGWNVIAAVQDNKIYAFDDNLASRPGPRLVDGLETIFKLLHP